jgi:hypothetical protein
VQHQFKCAAGRDLSAQLGAVNEYKATAQVFLTRYRDVTVKKDGVDYKMTEDAKNELQTRITLAGQVAAQLSAQITAADAAKKPAAPTPMIPEEPKAPTPVKPVSTTPADTNLSNALELKEKDNTDLTKTQDKYQFRFTVSKELPYQTFTGWHGYFLQSGVLIPQYHFSNSSLTCVIKSESPSITSIKAGESFPTSGFSTSGDISGTILREKFNQGEYLIALACNMAGRGAPTTVAEFNEQFKAVGVLERIAR